MIIVTVLYIIVCALLVTVVLLQQGRGAGLGILGGSSDTILGSNAGNVFTKTTSVLAILFVAGSLILSVLGSGERSAIEQEGEAPVPQATETIDGTIPPGSGIPEELTPAAPESDSQSPNSEVLIGTNAPGE